MLIDGKEYVLVPKVPTPEMKAAIVKEADRQENCFVYHPADFYRAMLSAAPSAPASQTAVVCRSCGGDGVVDTGFDPVPTKTCTACDGSGCVPGTAAPASQTEAQSGGPVAQEAVNAWQHVANEWADMATNGLQWLRNIKEGISSADEALANMEDNLRHCREVYRPPSDTHGPVAQEGEDEPFAWAYLYEGQWKLTFNDQRPIDAARRSTPGWVSATPLYSGDVVDTLRAQLAEMERSLSLAAKDRDHFYNESDKLAEKLAASEARASVMNAMLFGRVRSAMVGNGVAPEEADVRAQAYIDAQVSDTLARQKPAALSQPSKGE